MYALLRNITELCQRKHLKSARIGENGLLPVKEFMDSAQLIYDVFARTDMEMVCVGKLHLTFDVFQVESRDPALYCGGGADIHEYRRLNDAVYGGEFAAACGAFCFQ